VQQTRHVCLGRRRTTPRLAEPVAATSDWQVLVFDDYDQTEDDGHNVRTFPLPSMHRSPLCQWLAADLLLGTLLLARPSPSAPVSAMARCTSRSICTTRRSSTGTHSSI
jgi:hypothetical protein